MSNNPITDWIVAVCAVVTVVIGVLTLYQLYIQLKNLNNSLRNSTLSTLIDLENEIIRRKEILDVVNNEITKYNNELGENMPNEHTLALLMTREKSALENYLNSIDRLSYCILNEYFLDKDWRGEYRDVIFDIIDKKQEQFGPNTKYRNIKKLYNNWKDS